MTLIKGSKVEEVKVTEQKRTFPAPTLQHWADDYEPCDGYWSDLYEEMVLRQAAKEAGCSVKELCYCGYSAKEPKLGDGTRCAYCHDRHTEYLATRNAISSLEKAEVEVDWEEYEDDNSDDAGCSICTLTHGICMGTHYNGCALALPVREVQTESSEDEPKDDLEEIDDSCYECGGRSRLGVLCEKCIDDDEEHENNECDDQVTRIAYYVDWEEEEQALWYEDIEAALSASKTLIPRFKKRKTNYERKDLKPAHGAARRSGRRIKASWVR
jgi:hypothetical protein